MDCERFDDSVMDALYGELDELSAEALKRHVDACSRCSSQLANFKATRAAIQLPVVEPSESLTERILQAEGRALKRLPWHRKVVRAAAWAGSHAMRPQLAMAALFMFVIGSSMMLLRARPGAVSPPVTVRDEGRPGVDGVPAGRPRPDTESLRADDVDGDMGRGAKARAGDRSTLEDAPRPSAPQAAIAEGKSGSAESAVPSAPDLPLEEGDGLSADAQQGLANGLSLKKNGNCKEAMAALRAVEKKFPGSKEAEQAKAERDANDCFGGGQPAAPTPPMATASASAK